MLRRRTTRYIIDVDNRPGELKKLTSFLVHEGVDIIGLAVASFGDVASIQFSTSATGDLPERLKRSGIVARVDS